MIDEKKLMTVPLSILQPFVAGLLMTAGVNFGSAVIIFPGIAASLGEGWVTYFFVLFWATSINYYCVMLLNNVVASILGRSTSSKHCHDNDKRNDDLDTQRTFKESKHRHRADDEKENIHDTQRRPLQYCCQVIFGERSWIAFWVTKMQFFCILFATISVMLIIATTLQSSLPPLPINTSAANITRLWIVIKLAISMPLHTIENYKSMKYVGMVSMTVAFLALVVVVIASIVISVYIPLPSAEERAFLQTQLPLRSYNEAFVFFSCFGSMWFGFTGYAFIIPNIASFMPDVEALNKTVSVSIASTFLLYCIAGYVPYALLNGYVVDTSIITTLQRVANTANIPSLDVLCRLVELLLFIHFITASAMLTLPVYLVLEAAFKVPNSK